MGLCEIKCWWRRRESNSRPRSVCRDVYGRRLILALVVDLALSLSVPRPARLKCLVSFAAGVMGYQPDRCCPAWLLIRRGQPHRRSLIKLRKRIRNRCQLLLLPLFTRPAAPRPAVYGVHIPVETSAPPINQASTKSFGEASCNYGSCHACQRLSSQKEGSCLNHVRLSDSFFCTCKNS